MQLSHCSLIIMCLSSTKTVRRHIALLTQSSFCTVRHPTSPDLPSQQSWPKPGWLMHLGHDAEMCIPSANLLYTWVVAVACWDMRWISAEQGGLSISGDKDWKHVSMQLVVTLNTCCDTPCGAEHPFPSFFPPCPFTLSSFALFYFSPFSFSYSLYLFSSFVHPFHFYQNSFTPLPGHRS